MALADASLQVLVGQASEAGPPGLNQDFHGASLPSGPLRHSKGIVVALADGIGSSAVSQEASAAAVRGFLEDYYATSEAWPVRRAARCVLGACNSWLHAQNQRGHARLDPDRGLVCTFSALVFKGRDVHLLHVGDSRVYRVHPQALEQLSEDHRVHLGGGQSFLGRALGAAATVEIDHACWPAEPGELYLLATDGAYEHLKAADIHQAVQQHADDLDAAAAALVARALALGSDDNCTVQLVRVQSLPEAQAHELHRQLESLRLPPPLQPRMAFEGYRIVRVLHESARSQVCLALDEDSAQQVVLKTPAVELQSQPGALDRFLLEEWVARRVDHPHLVRAAPGQRPRHHLFVALEHVSGQTLAQWMTDHPRPSLDEVRRLVEQIARGLQALHRKEMLHQDLRPENLMVDDHGTVRLIDFGSVHVAGLAELDGVGADAAAPRQILGSLQYTAPEYFTGEGGSTASELFSLAVLTYQMLCGQLPYGLQVAQVRGPPDLARLSYVPLRRHRPDLPAWLDAVLRQALHPRPAQRQEALSSFVHELHQPTARQLRAAQGAALLQRDPLRFWQGLSLLLGLLVLGLLARLAHLAG